MTQDKTSPKKESGHQTHKILLVDDHDMIRVALRSIINKQDDMSVVAEASNGQEAFELAHKQGFDIIVMDVDMPVMDGIEATKKIKSGLPKTPIIGLSFHNSQEVRESMLNAGASAFVTKSEGFEILCKTIRAKANT